jgi:hypothetical protein
MIVAIIWESIVLKFRSILVQISFRVFALFTFSLFAITFASLRSGRFHLVCLNIFHVFTIFMRPPAIDTTFASLLTSFPFFLIVLVIEMLQRFIAFSQLVLRLREPLMIQALQLLDLLRCSLHRFVLFLFKNFLHLVLQVASFTVLEHVHTLLQLFFL